MLTQRNNKKSTTEEKLSMGLGMDIGQEYFRSLKARGLVSRKQRRNFLFFDIARYK